jgi:hypothetical protein
MGPFYGLGWKLHCVLWVAGQSRLAHYPATH